MPIRKRTNLKTDPDRNPQLADGEVQLEGFGGAVTVTMSPEGTHMYPKNTVKIRCMDRGYVKSTSTATRLDAENLDAFIDMLIDARSKL